MAGASGSRVVGEANDTMSILLLGSAEICTIFSDSLFSIQDLYNSSPDRREHVHLVVHKCTGESDLPRQRHGQRPSVDVVAIFLDTASRSCIQDARMNRNVVNRTLHFKQACLVNFRASTMTRQAVSPNDIVSLQLEYRLLLLKGDIYDSQDRFVMARKMVEFAKYAVGAQPGQSFLFHSEREEQDAGRGKYFTDVDR